MVHVLGLVEIGARLDRDDDLPAVGDQRGDDGAAETAGPAGYENGAIGHAPDRRSFVRGWT